MRVWMQTGYDNNDINKIQYIWMSRTKPTPTQKPYNRHDRLRAKTMTSPQFYVTSSNSIQDEMRRRMKSMIDETTTYLEHKEIKFNHEHTPLKLDLPLETGRKIQYIDEENENLTNDFHMDWTRMENNKRLTYSKLRNKFVKKFPSFREKYQKEDLDDDEIKPSSKRSYSENKSHLHSTYREVINNEHSPKHKIVVKAACFYSRSQKKCMYNSFVNEVVEDQEKPAPLPRMSFLTYLRSHKQKNILKVKKIRGQNMIKTRENILKLQKQGTKSFINLKRCLDQSIQNCL